MRLLLAMLISGALVLGIACGGDDDSSTSGGSGSAAAPATAANGSGASGGGATLQDACTLLSEEQVAAALGDDTVASTKSDPPTQALSMCQWQGSNAGNRYVNLSIRTAQFATSVFDSNYKTVAGAVSVPGIGDEAYALPGSDTPNNYRYLSMAALTSSLYIQLDIAGPNRSDEEALAALTTAMQQVVAKLN
jgi:Protein of unknown function (DUF3558)